MAYNEGKRTESSSSEDDDEPRIDEGISRQEETKSDHVLEEIKEEAETPRMPEDPIGHEESSERSKNPKSLQI